jgi:mono/diheme cytochrome c family protein
MMSCRSAIAFLVATALPLLPVTAPADEAAPSDDVSAETILVEEGARAFAKRCASCHGATATEGASGDIRGLGASVIRNAIGGIDQMPRVAVRPGEADAIAAWLAVAR